MNDFENENNTGNEELNENPVISDAPEADETLKPPLAVRFFKELLSWVMCLVIAFVAAFAIRTWLFTVVKVDGQSMEPTLHHNERLFTRIIGYEPERGDIVIFNPKSHPEVAYVKRVIALEGDRIWVDESNGEVHLKKSGSAEWEVLEEDYIKEPAVAAGIAQRFADSTGEEGLLIQKDHVFVMGDNRNHSTDSRSFEIGPVDERRILGKVIFRVSPFDRFGPVN